MAKQKDNKEMEENEEKADDSEHSVRGGVVLVIALEHGREGRR